MRGYTLIYEHCKMCNLQTGLFSALPDFSMAMLQLVAGIPSNLYEGFSSVRDLELIGGLSSCAEQRNLRMGSSLHTSIIKNPPFFDFQDVLRPTDVVIYNCLIHMYCECGDLNDACKVFDDMSNRDIVSWNSMISGFLRHGEIQKGFHLFKGLLLSGSCQLDNATLTVMLSMCGEVGEINTLKMMHGFVICYGYKEEMTVGNALTNSYFKCRACESGMLIFYEMVKRNVVTWTAAISGLAQNGRHSQSLKLFVEMQQSTITPNYLTYLGAISACSGLQGIQEGAQLHGVVLKLGIQSDMFIESSLMDMYSKFGCLEEVLRIFEFAEKLDEVSATVVLVCFAQNGFEEEAVQMFMKMVKEGLDIDPSMVSAILGALCLGASHGLGTQTHCLSLKRGLDCNIYVGNGLINMYSKCGKLEESIKVFNCMPFKNQVSWNSIIAAFARHGHGMEALELYEQMRSEGVEPTDVTFVSLLHACSHVGLVHKGMKFLELMERTHGIQPRMEHYACVIDMLGRAGLLKEANEFIEQLPLKPDALIWQVLLGTCGIHGDTDMGQYAANQLALVEPDSPVPFVSMANIYSSKGRWSERARTLKRMKEKGVMKEIGVSWIEIEQKIHKFVVADEMHPQGDDVYGALFHLFGHMTDEDDTLSQLL